MIGTFKGSADNIASLNPGKALAGKNMYSPQLDLKLVGVFQCNVYGKSRLIKVV